MMILPISLLTTDMCVNSVGKILYPKIKPLAKK